MSNRYVLYYGLDFTIGDEEIEKHQVLELWTQDYDQLNRILEGGKMPALNGRRVSLRKLDIAREEAELCCKDICFRCGWNEAVRRLNDSTARHPLWEHHENGDFLGSCKAGEIRERRHQREKEQR